MPESLPPEWLNPPNLAIARDAQVSVVLTDGAGRSRAGGARNCPGRGG